MHRYIYIIAVLLFLSASFEAKASNSPVEFCIDKSGHVYMMFGALHRADADFSGKNALRLFDPGKLITTFESSHTAGSARRVESIQKIDYERIKRLSCQFVYHFGIDNFLITDLPPPVLV